MRIQRRPASPAGPAVHNTPQSSSLLVQRSERGGVGSGEALLGAPLSAAAVVAPAVDGGVDGDGEQDEGEGDDRLRHAGATRCGDDHHTLLALCAIRPCPSFQAVFDVGAMTRARKCVRLN